MASDDIEEDDRGICMMPKSSVTGVEVTQGFLRDKDQKPGLYIKDRIPKVENVWNWGSQFEV